MATAPPLAELARPDRSLGHLIAVFVAMPWRDRLALAAAWLLLGLAAMLLRLVSFRKLARLLGRPLGAVACVPLIDARQEERAVLVHRAIARATRLSPLRSDCLPQALAASALCRLLGVPTAIHFGVTLRGEEAMAAHAWLASGQIAVTGGGSFSEYTVVACFLSGA